jgi:drug/metabolite transporter (DMT)-like permease
MLEYVFPNSQKNSTISMILLIAVYLGLNTSLNLLNKWALGHYGMAFPLTLTSAHMSFSFIVLAPFALRVPIETHVRTIEKQWRGIVYIGSFLALNIALNNISLIDISLSLNQVIRSSIPVVTCLLAIGVEGKMPSEKEATSLVVLTIGVMIAVWQGTVAGKPHAIIFCVVGTICNAAMMTFSGKLLSEKLDVVRLTFYTAPVSLLCLAPFMIWMELDAFQIYFAEHFNDVLGIILLSSVNAVTYNLVHSLMIKRSSAVTTTVLGEIKIVGLLILSAVILDEGKELTPKMLLGCFLAMAGFFMYSQTKIEKAKSKPNQHSSPALPSMSREASFEREPLNEQGQGRNVG